MYWDGFHCKENVRTCRMAHVEENEGTVRGVITRQFLFISTSNKSERYLKLYNFMGMYRFPGL